MVTLYENIIKEILDPYKYILKNINYPYNNFPDVKNLKEHITENIEYISHKLLFMDIDYGLYVSLVRKYSYFNITFSYDNLHCFEFDILMCLSSYIKGKYYDKVQIIIPYIKTFILSGKDFNSKSFKILINTLILNKCASIITTIQKYTSINEFIINEGKGKNISSNKILKYLKQIPL